MGRAILWKVISGMMFTVTARTDLFFHKAARLEVLFNRNSHDTSYILSGYSHV